MLKRVAIMLFCLMMVFIATFGFVVGVVAVPTIYSYAAVNDDPIYVPLRDPSDLVVGFQSYCKSRDLTIEGSLADAVTTFTTGAFNSACNELGINISQLQAEIKAEYDQSGKPVKFLLNDTGVMAMNRIFAQFLQDNELEVGDTDVNKLVHSGLYFTDADGYTCEIFTTTASSLTSLKPTNTLYGTPYKYNTEYFVNYFSEYDTNTSTTLTFNCSNQTIVNQRFSVYYEKNNNYHYKITTITANTSQSSVNGRVYYETIQYENDNTTISQTTVNETGYPCIVRFQNNLYFGVFTDHTTGNDSITQTALIENGDSREANIYIVSLQINNNIYEGDTIINNEGDIINEPDPVPPGGTDPGWDIGGGGGTATDGDGNTWNIQFPDFELPDLNIDWSINGLGEKFPFSIPFDLVALVTVLNAEPQAPRFEGTVNFGFTTWDYDINLQQFDSVAQACRIAELLLLVVGLILVTRSIIKG